MKHLFTIILAYVAVFAIYTAQAQVIKQDDPSGYIVKYDKNFEGIGPEVYFLPAPIPKIDDLKKQYFSTQLFVDSIKHKINQEQLLEDFKFLSGDLDIHAPNLSHEEIVLAYQARIQSAIRAESPAQFYSATNNYAFYLMSIGDMKNAIMELEKAVLAAEQTKNSTDIQLLQQNLINLFISTGNNIEAKNIADAQLQWAIKDKNQSAQGYAILNQARILAAEKDYQHAENTIIRKAFPLFNRSKNYEGKAIARIILAEIYRQQSKLTEAQWFLLQAKDIAHEIKLQSKILKIEYLLGISKYEQENFNVSKNELLNALLYTNNAKDKYTRLIIHDYLGRIALNQGDINTADDQLKKYWQLRNEIF